MKKDLVERIAARVHAVDHSRALRPASVIALRDAETQLGFNIPPLLRSIYLNVANGGFGPGYGVIGTVGGHASNLGTLVESSVQMRKGADYLGLKWNAGLLPFCEWGCNIFSCVNCEDPGNRVFQSDKCNARPQTYNLEEFFEMWLSGVDILDSGNSKGKTAEIINPFTRSKTHVSGGHKGTKRSE
jgi:hypothetical protein